MTNAGATLSRILGRVYEKVSAIRKWIEQMHVHLYHPHIYRDLCFLKCVSPNLSVETVTVMFQLVPNWTHLHPKWNLHILMFVCFFFPQSQTKMLEVHLVHPIQNEVSAHQIVLDSWSHKVLLSSCFNINYISLFCLAGCSHSFAHNVSILSFPAPPIMHSQFDKGFSYRKNFVWTKHIAEKGNV